ncbi:MAG: helix-turn-helix transcriptional regulator [Hydrogenophaga sp.]|nr:helix-turn-helix transcriptional regulator [Hydrogenophaga sp.]
MNTIKAIRDRLGLSQKALAAGMGCTQPNVGFYERGQTVPPGAAAKLIEFAGSRGLEITYDHVYGLRDLPEVPEVGARDSQPAPSIHG